MPMWNFVFGLVRALPGLVRFGAGSAVMWFTTDMHKLRHPGWYMDLTAWLFPALGLLLAARPLWHGFERATRWNELQHRGRTIAAVANQSVHGRAGDASEAEASAALSGRRRGPFGRRFRTADDQEF